MKRLLMIGISVLALLFFTPAQAEAGKNVTRFGIQFVSPTGEFTDIHLNETLKADNAVGIGLGYEHVFFSRVGVDFNMSFSKHDLNLSGEGTSDETGKLNMMMPLTAGFNFHVLRSRFIDLYFGPFAGHILFGDVDVHGEGAGSASADDTFGYGAVLGIDVSVFKKGLIITSAVKYLKATAELGFPDIDEIDLDPWVVQVGLGFRF